LLQPLNSCESGQAIFLSYGRFFAEFLNEVSPVHLGTLTPAHLCRFGVRTTHIINSSESFLGSLLIRIYSNESEYFANP